jgi:nucleoside-diphosphate-sugar epimerase
MHRSPETAAKRSVGRRIDWVKGDAMVRDDVAAAAQGAQVIVHAANPPGYKNWRGLAVPMLANSIEAARIVDARIMLPGNVYNFGPDVRPVATETSAQRPITRKGKIRVEMEEMLRAAASYGVRSVIVRAGDFIGADAPSSWFQTVMVKPGEPVRAVTYPGQHEIGHSWAYLPDLAETFACLADRESELPAYDIFHFGGHWFERGIEIAEAVRRVVGWADLPIKRFPWFAVIALSPVVELFREMLEMRYLWKEPLRLDNAKLVAFLGAEPHTPVDQAVRATLTELGCLPTAETGHLSLTHA